MYIFIPSPNCDRHFVFQTCTLFVERQVGIGGAACRPLPGTCSWHGDVQWKPLLSVTCHKHVARARLPHPAGHSECDHNTLLLESHLFLTHTCSSVSPWAGQPQQTQSAIHTPAHTRSHIHLECIQKGTSNPDLWFPHSLVLQWLL